MFISEPFSLNGDAQQVAGEYVELGTAADISAFHARQPQSVFEQVCQPYSKNIDGVDYKAVIYRDRDNPKSFEHLAIIFSNAESGKIQIRCGEKSAFILAAQTDDSMEFAIAGLEPKELFIFPEESKSFSVKFLDKALIEHEFQHGVNLKHDCSNTDKLSPSKRPLISGFSIFKSAAAKTSPQEVLERTIGLSPSAGNEFVTSLGR